MRLAGSVRRYFRKVLLEASDPGYRAQLAMLDEDAERLVYLQLGNFIRRVQAAPEQHLQDLALILAEGSYDQDDVLPSSAMATLMNTLDRLSAPRMAA